MTESTYQITLNDKQAKAALDGLIGKAGDLEVKLLNIGKAGTKAGTGIKSTTVALSSFLKQLAGMSSAAAGLSKIASKFHSIATAAREAGEASQGAAAGIGGVNAKAGGASAAASSLKGVAGAAMKIGQAAIRAANEIAEMGAEMLRLGQAGQQIQNLEMAFSALGGQRSELEGLRSVTANLVPDSTLVKMSNVAKTIGITSTQFEGLAKVATGAAFSMGRSFDESLERIILGAGKMEKELLDELGITFGSMTQLVSDHAKKVGIRTKDVTAAMKQQIFIQAIMANSTKQQELAHLAASDAFGQADASLTNLTDSFKKQISTALKSSGVLSALGGVVEDLGGEVMGLGQLLQGALRQAMEGLSDTFGDLSDGMSGARQIMSELVQSGVQIAVDLFGTLLAVVVPLLKPLSTMMAAFSGMTPLIKVLASVVGKLVGGLVQLLQIAITPLVAGLALLLKAAAKAAEVLGADGLARELRSAAAGFDEFIERALGTERTLAAVSEKAATAAIETKKAGKAAEQTGATFDGLSLSNEELAATFADASNEARKLTRELLLQGRLPPLFTEGSTESVKSTVSGLREAAVILSDFQALVNSTDGDIELAGRLMGQKFLEQAKGDENLAASMIEAARAQMEAAQAVVTGEFSAREKSQGTAASGAESFDLEKTDENEERAALLNRSNVEKRGKDLATAYDVAFDETLKSAEKGQERVRKSRRKSGKKSVSREAKLAKDLTSAINAAEKMIMGAEEHKRWMLLQERARLINALIGTRDDLAAAIQFQGVAEEFGIVLGERFMTMAEQLKPLTEEVGRLNAEFTSIAEAETLDDLAEQFERMALAQRDLFEISGEQADLDMAEKFDAMGVSARKSNQEIKGTATVFGGLMTAAKATGATLNDMFAQLAEGSKSGTDIIREVFVKLFMDLASALVAWASAQIAASINPWLGLAASIAFMAVISAIGGFMNRGKSSGGGGGGTAASASRASERDRDRKGRKDIEDPRIIIFNFGFSAPDEVAQSAAKADRRAARLRGKGG